MSILSHTTHLGHTLLILAVAGILVLKRIILARTRPATNGKQRRPLPAGSRMWLEPLAYLGLAVFVFIISQQFKPEFRLFLLGGTVAGIVLFWSINEFIKRTFGFAAVYNKLYQLIATVIVGGIFLIIFYAYFSTKIHYIGMELSPKLEFQIMATLQFLSGVAVGRFANIFRLTFDRLYSTT